MHAGRTALKCRARFTLEPIRCGIFSASFWRIVRKETAMKVYSTADLRNVALVGHGGTGKTSLVSALLFAAGAVNRVGRVDDGSAVTDYEDEETERKISLQTALAHLEWKGRKVNLIDTPGYAAFVSDAKLGVAVADTTLILIEAVAGVQVTTDRVWGYAELFGLPVGFVVNKLDRENASFERAVAGIRERFGRTAVPIQLPIGAEHVFTGIVDLLSARAYRFAADRSGKMTEEAVPAAMAEDVRAARAALTEVVAETDDALMERFFESGELGAEELLAGLRRAIAARRLFPIACASAGHVVGAQPLLDAIVDLLPDPAWREAVGTDPRTSTEVRRPVAEDQPLSAFVFKTVADPFAGRLTLFRVVTGTLKPDSHVINPARENHAERLGNLAVLQGKHSTPVSELHAGDLGVIAKLKETQTSDTLCDAAHPVVYPRVKFRDPAISFAVTPKSKGDEEKISMALARLVEEDPVLRVKRDARTGELLVSGTGQLHVEVALLRLKRKFSVEAELHPPKVPYLETIRRKVTGIEGKHKKQSGGRGQFGVCVIDMEPLPHGAGFEFVDKIFGGSIPQNYRPAVEKGVREASERGWRAGCPVVDFRVTLTDGKYHDVDSSEMAFKIAGSLAFQEAMQQAHPTILEPVMAVEITAPEEAMGDIMGDLSSRRGKPQGMEAKGAMQVIRAQVPMAEMLNYDAALKSMTSDRGSYTMDMDHYQEVPGAIQDKIVAKHAAAKAQEKTG
jgi:elongation factor G